MRVSRLSLLTRIGAAATVAAVAAGSVIATATAAGASTSHPKRLVTTLHIRNKVIAQGHHHADMIAGVLKSHRTGLVGQTVYLETRTAGKKFTVAGQSTTAAGGTVSFAVAPAKKTQYELVFKGAGHYRRSHSGVVTLRPRKG
jgi:hypothetical protein